MYFITLNTVDYPLEKAICNVFMHTVVRKSVKNLVAELNGTNFERRECFG
jgi:hypothetical protein